MFKHRSNLVKNRIGEYRDASDIDWEVETCFEKSCGSPGITAWGNLTLSIHAICASLPESQMPLGQAWPNFCSHIPGGYDWLE